MILHHHIKLFLRYVANLWIILLIPAVCMGERNKNFYRIPSIYNPNPVVGRLYLQPIGTHEDQSFSGFLAEVGLGSSVDYNIYFTENPERVDERLTVNSNILSVKVSNGFSTFGHTLETGGILRSHQDVRTTFMSTSIKNYHEFMNFGNIPPKGQYYGGIGENQTGIIAENSGDIFLTTLQLYAKIQVLEDKGIGSYVPNLSFKTSIRLPLSEYGYDRNGISLSTGISKEVYTQFILFFAAGLIYQDISPDDFNATNIEVKKRAYDVFSGFIWDAGQKGAWYVSSGLRVSSERIYYTKNPDSADTAYCTHWGLFYRKTLQNGNMIEFFFNCNEDLPGLGYGLEPDFRVQSGVTINFENRN